MKEFLLVFLGGGVGSMMRYVVTLLLGRVSAGGFPWATFTVNVVGSFLIGALSAWVARGVLSADARLLLVVGVCGGFTTFSTFSNEMLSLLRSGQTAVFFLYTFVSLALGLLAVWAAWRWVS